MAKGFNENQERRQTISKFGKDLARRCKSKCELTGESGVPLSVFEIPPTKNSPDFDRCIMISDNAREQIANPKKLQAGNWRHLNELVWSETPAIQIIVVRILQHLSPEHSWAQDILSEAFIDEETITIAEAAKLGE